MIDLFIIAMVIGFGFLSALSLLSCSACAVKKYRKEQEVFALKRKFEESLKHRRAEASAVIEVDAESDEPIEVS